MTNSPIPISGSEFNDFLFAPIGEDRNGMLVSVLSGLARSDVDPWQEAARLAQLPGETAAERLATLIYALPDGAASYPDPRAIATRLIALLPRSPGSNGGPQKTLPGAWAEIDFRPWWVYVVVISFVLGSQLLIASHQLSAKPDNVEVTAGAGSIVAPAPPPANSGQ
jgi:hypothetical protein